MKEPKFIFDQNDMAELRHTRIMDIEYDMVDEVLWTGLHIVGSR